MVVNNKTENRESVAFLGISPSSPTLYRCSAGVYEIDLHGSTYRFKAKDNIDALDKVYHGEYKD